ncbi:MAG: hypothetical protein QXP60_09375 [Nitrososphaerota archaeon]
MLKSPKRITKKIGANSPTGPMAIFPGCGTDVCATICSVHCGGYGGLDWHTAMHWATTWI